MHACSRPCGTHRCHKQWSSHAGALAATSRDTTLENLQQSTLCARTAPRTRVARMSSGLDVLMVPPMMTSPGFFHRGAASPVTMACRHITGKGAGRGTASDGGGDAPNSPAAAAGCTAVMRAGHIPHPHSSDAQCREGTPQPPSHVPLPLPSPSPLPHTSLM